ncbi:MAG TPA: SRPBCC family protein [Terriglobales bacterium]|jgi:activator of HSP90 ATPase|nr:SRPBCC family protein [Terriglobales bacterium]
MMNEGKKTGVLAVAPTRRQVIASGAVTLASLAMGSVRVRAQQTMVETPSTSADKTRTSLHQEVDFKATPHRIYTILLDSKQFSAFSTEPATISPEVGGAFSMFGARIVGRNIELVSDQRIVQAWRPAYWEPGVYSLVKFEFKAQGPQTHVVLDHTGFPEGDFASLSSGWKEHYWERLAKYLG